MNTTMKRLTILLFVLAVPVALSAFSFGADNHQFNPAFLGSSTRTWETGVSGNLNVYNSYFAITDFLSEEEDAALVIDLGDLAEAMAGGKMETSLGTSLEVHAMAQLFGIGVGGYAAADLYGGFSIPESFFTFLAEGNTIGDEITGEGELNLKGFAEVGVYAGYRYGNYQIGLKFGQYVPLIYSEGTGYSYSLLAKEADEDGIIFEAEAEAFGTVYSAFDLDDPGNFDSPMDILTGAGTKLDIGFVHVKQQGRPLWGASASIPLLPAKPAYAFELTGGLEATITDPLGSISFGDENGNGDDNDNGFAETENTFELSKIEGEIDKEIMAPYKLGGFYRFTLIPVIDLIPHVEMVFEDPMLVNYGLTLTGSFAPLSWVSLGMGQVNNLWVARAGLDVDLRLLEVGVRVSSSSESLETLASFQRPDVSFQVALGL